VRYVKKRRINNQKGGKRGKYKKFLHSLKTRKKSPLERKGEKNG
jgi:hypothetical protein